MKTSRCAGMDGSDNQPRLLLRRHTACLDTLAQIAAGCALDKVEGEAIFRPDAFYLFQLMAGRIKYGRQGTKDFQGLAGRFFTIGTRVPKLSSNSITSASVSDSMPCSRELVAQSLPMPAAPF